MSIVDTVAGAIGRMDDGQVLELLRRVVPTFEIRMASHNPETHAVVPRRLTEAMFYSVRHDQWTESSARRVLQELWRKAIEAAEREGHGA